MVVGCLKTKIALPKRMIDALMVVVVVVNCLVLIGKILTSLYHPVCQLPSIGSFVGS